MSRARAALAAILLFAAATPWVLRPWFGARDALPRAAGAMGGMPRPPVGYYPFRVPASLSSPASGLQMSM